ncbi:MAG: PaaX family transcriptional regulator C-terminal domain-containing protein [Rhizobiaceae bacterium]
MSDFEDLLKQVKRGEKLRVWSLIITFFGDAVMPRGGAVSASTISAVMAQIGIEAGAVRTALSRLASDGWVVREKIGRNAYYRLSPMGHEPFENAASRIYACRRVDNSKNKPWMIAIAAPNGTGDMAWAEQYEGLCFASNIALFNDPSTKLHDVATKEECMVIEGDITAFPKWLTKWVQPNQSKLAYENIMAAFGSFTPSTPLEAIAVRTLLIHQWRRQLLRTPDLPVGLFTKDWAGFACRELVCELYKQILPLSEEWLDEQIDGEQPDLSNRFG